jgi:Ca2+-binding RTX toxin-like protein
MKIQFDYRFDTNGFFKSTERRAALEKAGEIWSNLIKDDFENLPAGIQFTVQNPQTGKQETIVLDSEIDDLVIFVGASPNPFQNSSTGNTSSVIAPNNSHLSGCCCSVCSQVIDNIDLSQPGILKTPAETSEQFEVLARAKFDGIDVKADIFQRRVSANFRDRGVTTDFEPWVGAISFGSNRAWSFNLNNPDANKFDFISVALHEIGHVLGIGTAPAFDALAAGAVFNGVNSKRINSNSPIPLESDLGHVKDGFENNSVLFDPILQPGRDLPSNVDLALLADIGYEIDGFTKQGSIPALATESGEGIFGATISDVIDGLGGDDEIQGNEGNDTLKGGVGNDSIFGGDGNDSIFGDASNDTLQGGLGNDTISGGDGNDNILGEKGSDALNGNAGNDTLQGDTGNDTLNGNDGDDLIGGQDGADSLLGNSGKDQLLGASGNDTLQGGSGDDTLLGEEGNDIIIGGTGNDTLSGSTGSDFFNFELNSGNDVITDFVAAEDVIKITSDYDFSTNNEILQALKRIGSTTDGRLVSDLALDDNNLVRIFHDSPLTTNNLAIDFPLQVDFQTTNNGFSLQFNEPLNLDVLNLYPTANSPADLNFVRVSTGETVKGSLIWQESDLTLKFVATEGILAPDEYRLTLFSRQDGFVNRDKEILDGNRDDIDGGNFTTKFTVASNQKRVLSLEDLRQELGTVDRDLSVTLNNGSQVTKVDLTLTYNPDILDITDILLAPNLDASWKISNKNLTKDGTAIVSLTGTSSLPTGDAELVSLQTEFLETFPYGSSGLIQFQSVSLNGGNIGAIGNSGIAHKDFLGDANGNGSYEHRDAALISELASGVSESLSDFSLTDPLLIADVNGDGVVSAFDSFLIATQNTTQDSVS